MIKNTQGHVVNKTDRAAVQTNWILKQCAAKKDYTLFDKAMSEAIKIDSVIVWITTVSEALMLGLDCMVIDDNGNILNSYVSYSQNMGEVKK